MSSGAGDYSAWIEQSDPNTSRSAVKLGDIDAAMLVDALELVFEAGWAATMDFKASEAALGQLKREVEQGLRSPDDAAITFAEVDLDQSRLRVDEITEIGEVFDWWHQNEIDAEPPETTLSADVSYSIPVGGEVISNYRHYWFTSSGIVVHEVWGTGQKVKMVSADVPLNYAVSRALQFANAQWREIAAFDRELASL